MSKGAKLPYVRFYASDWLAGTRGMSAIEVGIYITLLMMMYERCEPIPADNERLARYCGSTRMAFEKVVSSLVKDGKITVVDDGYWNERVEKEFNFREKSKEKKIEAARKRWENTNKNNDEVMHVQELCNAESMLSQKPEARIIKKEPSVPKKKVGYRLPDDFKPDVKWSLSQGLPVDVLEREFEKFKNYWTAKSGKDATKLDWQATWRNWIINAKDRIGKTNGGAKMTVADYSLEQLRKGQSDEQTTFNGTGGLLDYRDTGPNSHVDSFFESLTSTPAVKR